MTIPSLQDMRGLCLLAIGGLLSPAPTQAAALPPHPWGVYSWGGKSDIPADMPIRGIPITWRWHELEPARGKYNFDEAVRRPLEQLKAHGHYTHIMFHVAPITPDWVYAAGVPKVIVPERITPARKLQKPTYPYYFDPLFKDILHHTVTALANYLAALPADLKGRIIFLQVAEGSTGDGQPYKGVPVDPKYRISEEAWNDYRREKWAYYQAAFQRADGSLNIPLLVNGDANTSVENQWLLDHCQSFGIKQGMFSHGYLASAKAYAPLGARQGDPEKATGGGMRNRQADDQNDVGWGILPGNFERHLTQLRPEETSIGLWDTGPAKHPYGLFARRFDRASGRKAMNFRLADGFFAQPASAHAVKLRIVYLDAGQGGWELAYATAKGEKVATQVALTGRGEWRDANVTLPDAVWDHRLNAGGDLALRSTDGTDITFHLIELARQ